MKNYTIVSLADANYFDLLNELVNSILQFKESDDVDICLHAESREGQFLLTMDSRPVSIVNGKKIILKKANFSIKLIELTDQNFFKTIRNKLFWGKDSRN